MLMLFHTHETGVTGTLWDRPMTRAAQNPFTVNTVWERESAPPSQSGVVDKPDEVEMRMQGVVETLVQRPQLRMMMPGERNIVRIV